MARKLADRLFLFLWHRYVEGRSDDEAAERAGITVELFEDHRARRSPQYAAAERRLDQALPAEMLLRYAKAAQLRVLMRGSDSSAASVAARVLDRLADQHDRQAEITFIIEEADDQPADAQPTPQPPDRPPGRWHLLSAPPQQPPQHATVRIPMAAAGAALRLAAKELDMAAAKRKTTEPARPQTADDAAAAKPDGPAG